MKYSYMNKARKMARKMWLADKRGEHGKAERFNRRRAYYETKSGMFFLYT